MRMSAPGGSSKLLKERLQQAKKQRCQKYFRAALKKLAQGHRRAVIGASLANDKDLKQQSHKLLSECN